MAVRWAVQNGNWSDPNTWNGGTLPGSGDDVYANGRIVTIDQNVTCLSLRTEAESSNGVISGGQFECSITATIDVRGGIGIRAGTSKALYFTGAVEYQLTVLGNVTGGIAGYAYGIYHTGAGNLVVVGDVAGGPGTSCRGIHAVAGNMSVTGNVTGGSGTWAVGIAAGPGSTIITGNVTGGSGGECRGIDVGTGSVSVTGNVAGGITGNTHGVSSISGTITITGNVTGGPHSGAHGVVNESGTVTITGDVFNGAGFGVSNNTGTVTIYGSAKPGPANPLGNHVLYHASTTSGYIAVDAIEPDPTVLIFPSVRGRIFIRDKNTGYIRFYDTQGQLQTFITNDNVNNPPAESDVRYGVQYTAGNSRTGTAHIPPPASVAYGVPVDHTTGTAVLTAAAVANAVWDEPRAGHSTQGSFGAAIDTNIASRLAADDARLANLDAAVSTRLSQSDISSITTNVFSNTIENGITFQNLCQILGAVIVGQISTSGTDTEVFKAINNSAVTRVTVSVDSSGNRTGVTFTL